MASPVSVALERPVDFPRRAEGVGHRAIFETAVEGFHLQHYELQPGSIRQDPTGVYRITLRQKGQPTRMERWIEGRWERGIKAPGFICISPCDSLQRSAWDRGATSTLFFADKSVLDRLARESGLAPEAQLRSPLAANDPLIRHSLASLVEHQLTHGSVPRLLFSSAGQHIAMHLLVHYSLSARPETAGGTMPAWRLKRAIDYIEAHLGDNFGLDELAAAVEMTPHYFCRAFRMTTGVPPYRYALNRRIERAKELLSTTARSVTDIAFELGFASNAHFSSSFRQTVGHPPSRYRRIAGSPH